MMDQQQFLALRTTLNAKKGHGRKDETEVIYPEKTAIKTLTTGKDTPLPRHGATTAEMENIRYPALYHPQRQFLFTP